MSAAEERARGKRRAAGEVRAAPSDSQAPAHAPIPKTGRFRPADRIRRTEDFARAKAEGRRVDAGTVVVFVLPNDLRRTRLGISIGRRFGTAVSRNRVKRLLREAFRLERAGMANGIDLVVLVRPHRERPLGDYREVLRRAGT